MVLDAGKQASKQEPEISLMLGALQSLDHLISKHHELLISRKRNAANAESQSAL